MSVAEQRTWTGGHQLPVYPFVPPPELAGGVRPRYPVVIVGRGFSDGSPATLVEFAERLGTVCIGILYGPTRGQEVAAFARLEAAGLPFRFFLCGPGGIGDPEGQLKQVLGAGAGSFALIRPDVYLAGCVPDAKTVQAETML